MAKKTTTKPKTAQPKTKANVRRRLDICIVTRELFGWSEPSDASAATAGLAQNIAGLGDRVTILWVPPYSDHHKLAQGEGERLKRYYLDNYLVKLEILTKSPELSPLIWGYAKGSAAVYYHLKAHKFDAVYFSLEGGSAYYSLIAAELGLFENRPRLNVIANTPVEWKSEADRYFLRDLEEVTAAYMEKYCVGAADALICSDAALLAWFEKKKWPLAAQTLVLPNLRPFEWADRRPGTNTTSEGRIEEIVYLGGPHFREGLPLLCDALDIVARSSSQRFTITMLGRFGQVLGEHTGGLLVRRGRRWPFDIRLLPRLSETECLAYLKDRNCLVVYPAYTAGTPLALSVCLHEKVPFVATDVGGIPEMLDADGAKEFLVAAKAAPLAKAISDRLGQSARAAKPSAKFLAALDAWRLHLQSVASAQWAEARKPASKKAAPKVSIVMVHYDRPNYLTQAIKAVEEQDYPNFELILVDDGSKLPESRAKLKELQPFFKRKGWKILFEKNRYLGAARNSGVRASTGDRILFVDDDNALFKHAVSTYVKAMDASGADICTSFQKLFHEPFIPTDEKHGYIYYFPLGGSLDLGFMHDSFGDANAMIRRSVFDKIGFQIEDYGYTAQDWEFYTRATLAGLKLRIIPEPLYWYRSSSEGMYRTSHWYDNRLPILKAFKKHNYAGLDLLYHLVLSQNVGTSETQSYRENLFYNISDERNLQLARMDADSDEAYELLAEIAASEGRGDTGLALLASARKPNFRDRAIERLSAKPLSEVSLAVLGTGLTQEEGFDQARLQSFEVYSSDSSAPIPDSYIEENGRLFVRARNGTISIAVLRAGCPGGTTKVSARVSLEQAQTVATEFLILAAPTYLDPLLAVSQTKPGVVVDGSSGWQNVTYPYEAANIDANFAVPVEAPMNLILAVRSRQTDGKPPQSTTGCFSRLVLRREIAATSSRRPRVGIPPHRQRARLWTNQERSSATLLSDYASDLPLVLFPPEGEGLFLRPSVQGTVVASLPWSFPPFARKVIGSVEIAHEESSPFEFAIALTRPTETIHWTGELPSDYVAFSGWLRVEDKFKLHEVTATVREVLRTHLTINLAIRLPKGSLASPANAFWRKLILVWDE